MRHNETVMKKILMIVICALLYAFFEAFGQIPAPYWEINLGICYGFSGFAGLMAGPWAGLLTGLAGEVLAETLMKQGFTLPLILAAAVSGFVCGGGYPLLNEKGTGFTGACWRKMIHWTILGQGAGFLIVLPLGYWILGMEYSYWECFWRFFYNSICQIMICGLLGTAAGEENRRQSSPSSSSSSNP
jgi:uncharacterized membrane protein